MQLVTSELCQNSTLSVSKSLLWMTVFRKLSRLLDLSGIKRSPRRSFDNGCLLSTSTLPHGRGSSRIRILSHLRSVPVIPPYSSESTTKLHPPLLGCRIIFLPRHPCRIGILAASEGSKTMNDFTRCIPTSSRRRGTE